MSVTALGPWAELNAGVGRPGPDGGATAVDLAAAAVPATRRAAFGRALAGAAGDVAEVAAG